MYGTYGSELHEARREVLEKWSWKRLARRAGDMDIDIEGITDNKSIAWLIANHEVRAHAGGASVAHSAPMVSLAEEAIRDMMPKVEKALSDVHTPEEIRAGIEGPDVIHLDVSPRLIKTESADHIINVILPHVISHFLRKNADYGDNHRNGLGLKAEWVGVHRKIQKLQSCYWDGKDMNGENGPEMISDVIGQFLLMLDLISLELESNHSAL